MNKDNSKDKMSPVLKNDKKKKGFLKPVSLAVTAVLMSSPLINAGVAQADIDSAYNKSKEHTSERIVEELIPLIIKPSNKDLVSTVAAHESHSSHGSHESHSSHVSSS